MVGCLVGKIFLAGGSVVGVFNKIPFLVTANLIIFVNLIEMT